MSGRRPTRCCAFRNRTPIGLSTVPASLRVVKQMFFSMMIDGYIEEKSRAIRSEEHTSEPQSRLHVVCRLLLERETGQGTTQCATPHVRCCRRLLRHGASA